MTELEYIHHQEQMEAARREFSEWWNEEKKFLKNQGIGGLCRINVEHSSWKAFLKAKGLYRG